MAGRAESVSVSSTLDMPAQPASGELVIRPLGGDGYTSPQSYYLVNFDLDADGSGGTITLRINFDPQFQSVVSLIHCKMTSAAADRQIRIDIFPVIWQAAGPKFSVSALAVQDADVGLDLLYAPPPVFNVGRVGVLVDNVDTENLDLNMVIYNFKRDAFTKTPLNVILASLPRGFDIQ